MGIPLDHLVDQNAVQQLLCAICLELLDDPVSLNCPAEHTCVGVSCAARPGFCRNCVASIPDEDLTCPTCRFALSRRLFRPNKFAARLVLSVLSRCPYSIKCGWLGDLHGLRTHADACPFNVRHCPYRSRGCNLRMSSGRLAAHIEACGFHRIPCPNASCSKRFMRKDEAWHLSTCALWQCQHAHCPFVGTQVNLVMHQPACDSVAVQLAEATDEKESLAADLDELRERYDDLRKYAHDRIGLPERHLYSTDSEPGSDGE